MSKLSRFIQFNDETVEAKTMLLYERLARALANYNDVELTERKLMEFQIAEQKIAMSVFWRHRDEEIMHLGRLSDIYLLAGGYWKYFDLKIWNEFVQFYKDHR
ncbi:MAG TPA: VWA domain-containing protein, partial [Sporosarcina sp.]|nr:VWA domain-containing protein [Sporosarcina sp.]